MTSALNAHTNKKRNFGNYPKVRWEWRFKLLLYLFYQDIYRSNSPTICQMLMYFEALKKRRKRKKVTTKWITYPR